MVIEKQHKMINKYHHGIMINIKKYFNHNNIYKLLSISKFN